MMKDGLTLKKRSPAVPFLIGVGALTAAALSAVGGWIVYSRLAIPDQMELPEALSAQRKTFTSPTAGKLSYYMDASVAGQPLVLLHSVNAAASAFEMKPLFEIYRSRRPVYALDLPGYGFSERAGTRYTPELFSEAVRDLIVSQIGMPADVVALSLSSEFAARTALDSPQWIRSLVLISPTGLNAAARSQSARRAPTSQGSASSIYPLLSFPLWARPLFELIASRPSIRYFLSKSFVGPVPEQMIRYSYLSSHQSGAEHVPLHFISGQLFTPHARKRLYARITQPTLILYDQDPYTSFENLPRLLDQKRNWRAERIIPTRGLPHWEMPDATVEVMDRFWQSLSA